MQIYWNKRSVCIRKEFNSQRIGLGHQHGRRFIVWDTNMAVVTSCENTLYSNQAPRENSNFANTSLLRIPRWQWQQMNSLQKYYTNFRIKKYQLKYIFVWPLYMLRSRLTGKPVQCLFTIEWSLLTVHVIVRSGFPITGAPNENIVQNHINIALLNVL